MKLLHVIASPRGKDSRTLRLSNAVMDRIAEEVSGIVVDTVDLFGSPLPRFGAVEGEIKYSLMRGQPVDKGLADWAPIEQHIRRFLRADVVVISTPMWNFGVPYVLKQYIDVIFQPGYLFQYTEKGPQGLAKGKKLIVVSTRGGDYGPDSPYKAMDQLEPYLRTVFGFAGIADMTFVSAQPMDAGGPKAAEEKLQEVIRGLKTAPLMLNVAHA
jgi:FMN-dependent NADH-azoreductase